MLRVLCGVGRYQQQQMTRRLHFQSHRPAARGRGRGETIKATTKASDSNDNKEGLFSQATSRRRRGRAAPTRTGGEEILLLLGATTDDTTHGRPSSRSSFISRRGKRPLTAVVVWPRADEALRIQLPSRFQDPEPASDTSGRRTKPHGKPRERRARSNKTSGRPTDSPSPDIPPA